MTDDYIFITGDDFCNWFVLLPLFAPPFFLLVFVLSAGSEPGFYQWSGGVRLRANLDLLLDWAHTAGLGEVALENTHTLSSAINLLATPRKNLLQVSGQ